MKYDLLHNCELTSQLIGLYIISVNALRPVFAIFIVHCCWFNRFRQCNNVMIIDFVNNYEMLLNTNLVWLWSFDWSQ